MDITYRPYIDPELEGLIERINPPRVCIDNDTYPDCTLVKVDSANKHGKLLVMVQVLTDIDLVISKSYISSDGGWLMDVADPYDRLAWALAQGGSVFHVTDQLGNKITDESLIHYIQEEICANRMASKDVQPTISRQIKSGHVVTGQTALEMTGIDRPGLMSEMSVVLAELGCHVSSAVAWTHNRRVACIIYVEDSSTGQPITDPCRIAQVQAQLENVVEAHHYNNERRCVRLAAPAPGRTHTERRLHQLMEADKDYEECCSCCGGNNEDDEFYGYAKHCKVQRKGCYGTHVRIEYCKETGYSIINIRCRDRTKLLFDTVCTLTDLGYVVYHAAISSKGSLAFQEYYVKHNYGFIVDSEEEKRRVTQCLIAATERRVSYGLRLDVCTENKTGLLSDVTRIFRENGLSIARAEVGIRNEKAVGTFYLKDMSGQNVSPEALEKVRREIGGSVVVDTKSPVISTGNTPSRTVSNASGLEEENSRFSLGHLLWTHLEKLSSNFRSIQS